MNKNNLFKVMMILLMLMLVFPVMAQEGTQEAEPDVTEAVVIDATDGVVEDVVDAPEIVDVIETPDTVEPVIVIEDDDYNFVGIIVVGAIAIVMQLVNGFTNGRFLQTAETAFRRHVLDNEPLGNQIETRVSRWSERDRLYANSILNVIDPYTRFAWTDLDDDAKAWFRDKFDGVVEPGNGVVIQPQE